MSIRIVAGLGMLLLAAGLMFLWYLDQRTEAPSAPVTAAGPAPAAVHRIPGLAPAPGPADADSVLAAYTARWRALRAVAVTTSWEAAQAGPGDADAARRHSLACRALDDFTGGRETIAALRRLRGRPDLSELQDRQVEAAWRLAARRPGASPELAARLYAAGRALAQARADHAWRLPLPGGGTRPTTAAVLDSALAAGGDPARLRALWEASRAVGAALKPELVELRGLRNEAARSMGYTSWFGLQAAALGRTAGESDRLLQAALADLQPLYRQLHCWARHELARRHGVPVPARLPVAWLGDGTGRRWTTLAAPADADAVQPAWVLARAREFWGSLGLPALPARVLLEADRSGPDGLWDVDLDGDVRVLLRVDGGLAGLRRAHARLGRVHAHVACAGGAVPPLLRGPADPAFAAGLAGWGALACAQPPYLDRIAWPGDAPADDLVARLLDEALTGPVAALPYLAGTLAGWEQALYEDDLPAHRFNSTWWDLAGARQGLAPPALRGEEWCDPAAAPEVTATPGAGWQEAVGMLMTYQLHRFLCRTVLDQEPWEADYAGRAEVGLFLHDVMALGGTRDGLVILRQATGEDLGADALLAHFAPLRAWLEEQNAGRDTSF